MTLAIKGTVRFGDELAFPVGANGGERKQFFPFPDHEESLVAKIIVNSVGGVVAGRSRVHDPFCVRGRGTFAVVKCVATRGHRSRRQNQKPPPVHADFCILLKIRFQITSLKFEYQAGDDTPMQVRARRLVNGEDKSESRPRLDRADGFEVEAEAQIANEAVLAGVVLV